MTKRPWVEELYSHLPQKSNTSTAESNSEPRGPSSGLDQVVNFLDKRRERDDKRAQAEKQMKEAALEAYKKIA